MKDVGGVTETRSWFANFKSAWAITPSKNSRIKIIKPHAHLHIIGRKSAKISNESNERRKRSCGDKIMVGKKLVESKF